MSDEEFVARCRAIHRGQQEQELQLQRQAAAANPNPSEPAAEAQEPIQANNNGAVRQQNLPTLIPCNKDKIVDKDD